MRSCSKLNSGFWHEKIKNDCKVETKRKFWTDSKYYSVWTMEIPNMILFLSWGKFPRPLSKLKNALDLWNVHFMSLWFSMKLRSSLGTSLVPSSNNQSAFFFREKPDFLQILRGKKNKTEDQKHTKKKKMIF